MPSDDADGRAGPGPARPDERALAPDLARGFMLLMIVLANTPWYLYGQPTGMSTVHPEAGSALDRIVQLVIITFVDSRVYPMFAFLFGYGLARILDRQQQSGVEWKQVRKLIRRRSLGLMVLGFLHAILLYIGDILAAYGVLSFLFVRLLRWKDRTLLIIFGLVVALHAIPSADSFSISDTPPDATMQPASLLAGIADRATLHPILAPLEALGLFGPFLVGVVAGRRRILEQPRKHLRLLKATAAVGIPIAALGGLPVALVIAGVVDRPDAGLTSVLGTLHDSTGYFGGFGYAAAIALIALRMGDQPGPLTKAIAAVGQRSLTCYLAQSVVWTLAFAPYAADLSTTLGVTTTAGLALATWLLTVLLAEAMRRRSYRGPFELLLRRVAYGRRR